MTFGRLWILRVCVFKRLHRPYVKVRNVIQKNVFFFNFSFLFSEFEFKRKKEKTKPSLIITSINCWIYYKIKRPNVVRAFFYQKKSEEWILISFNQESFFCQSIFHISSFFLLIYSRKTKSWKFSSNYSFFSSSFLKNNIKKQTNAFKKKNEI